MKTRNALFGLSLLIGSGHAASAQSPQQPQQPTLEQNVDAMTSKMLSTISAFHDTIIGMNSRIEELTRERDTLRIERDALKTERDTFKTMLRGRQGPIPPPTPEGVTPDQPGGSAAH